MPIYLETRGVVVNGNPLKHMYLVYVPEGSESVYSAWETIGGFPEVPSSLLNPLGPWGNLLGLYLGVGLPTDGTDDGYPLGNQTDPEPYAIQSRDRALVYEADPGQTSEAEVWAAMVDTATSIADQTEGNFTYIATTITNLSYFGATTNSNSFAVSNVVAKANTKCLAAI